jgi:acyl carrier protein
VSEPAVTEEAVFNRVRRTVSQVLKKPEAEIDMDSRFVEDLGADSFDNLSMFMALEDEFGGSIPDDAAREMTTVGGTVRFILRFLGERQGVPDPPAPPAS